jgi:hypothetical protein
VTAQIHDTIQFNDLVFSITGIDGEGLFNPLHVNLVPTAKSTATWRGYACQYAVRDGRLVLDKLEIDVRGDPPLLFETVPIKESGGFSFDAKYTDLDHATNFSGRILAGQDFISELYEHMGFHPAWKFRRVHEFHFHEGALTRELDRTADAEAFRNRVAQDPELAKRTIEETFQRALDPWALEK